MRASTVWLRGTLVLAVGSLVAMVFVGVWMAVLPAPQPPDHRSPGLVSIAGHDSGAFVLWETLRRPGSTIHIQRRTAGNEVLQEVDLAFELTVLPEATAVDSSGNLHILGSRTRPYVKVSPSGALLVFVEELLPRVPRGDGYNASIEQVRVAWGAADRLHLAWVDGRNTDLSAYAPWDIGYAQMDTSGTLVRNPVVITPNTTAVFFNPVTQPALAVDATNRAHVAWTDLSGIVYAVLDADGNVSSMRTIVSTGPDTAPSVEALVLDPAGDAYVFYESFPLVYTRPDEYARNFFWEPFLGDPRPRTFALRLYADGTEAWTHEIDPQIVERAILLADQGRIAVVSSQYGEAPIVSFFDPSMQPVGNPISFGAPAERYYLSAAVAGDTLFVGGWDSRAYERSRDTVVWQNTVYLSTVSSTGTPIRIAEVLDSDPPPEVSFRNLDVYRTREAFYAARIPILVLWGLGNAALFWIAIRRRKGASPRPLQPSH